MLLFFRNSEKEEYSSYIRRHPFPDTKENITKSTRKLEIIVGNINFTAVLIFRSSRPEVFLGKCALKICSKFTGEHNTYAEVRFQISLRHGFSPVTLLHIFKITFPKSTSGRLLLSFTHFFLHFFSVFYRNADTNF